ncbi:SWIM-type domain-containing protein [Entamoeba marina]
MLLNNHLMLNCEEKLVVNGIWPSKASLKAAVIADGVSDSTDRRYWRVTRSSKEYLSLTCCFANECKCPAVLRASRSSRIPGRPWVVREIQLCHGDQCKGKTPKKFFGTDYIKSVLPAEALSASSSDVAKLLQEKSGLNVARRTITRLQKNSKPKTELMGQILMNFIRLNPGSRCAFDDHNIRVIIGTSIRSFPYLQPVLISSKIQIKDGCYLMVVSALDGNNNEIPLCFSLTPSNSEQDYLLNGLREVFVDQIYINNLIDNMKTSNDCILNTNWCEVSNTSVEILTYIFNTLSTIFNTRNNQYKDMNGLLVDWVVKDCLWRKEVTKDSTCYGHYPIYSFVENEKHTINLQQRTCTCGKYQEHGIPCIHAIAVISQYYKDKYECFTDRAFYVDSLRSVYQNGIISVGNSQNKKGYRKTCRDSSDEYPTKRRLRSPMDSTVVDNSI